MHQALFYGIFWEYSALGTPAFLCDWIAAFHWLKRMGYSNQAVPKTGSGLGFSPRSWGKFSRKCEKGKELCGFFSHLKPVKGTGVKPVRSENFPAQTKAWSWCLLGLLAWAGGSSRAGEPEKNSPVEFCLFLEEKKNNSVDVNASISVLGQQLESRFLQEPESSRQRKNTIF